MKRLIRSTLIVVGLGLSLAACWLQWGCALGRGADGAPVWGIEIAPPDPESINELAAIVAPFAGPYAPLIFGGGGVLSMLAGWLGGKKSGEIKGIDKGWEEREKYQERVDREFYEGRADAARTVQPAPTTAGEKAT